MLKNVPTSMSEVDIVTMVRAIAGNVSKVFRYEPERSTGVAYASNRRHRTYSVLMDDEEAAARLISLCKIPLPSIGEIIIEKFHFKHKRVSAVAANYSTDTVGQQQSHIQRRRLHDVSIVSND